MLLCLGANDRESSFFRNPHVPKSVNNSRVAVEVCAKGSEGCCDGSSAAELKVNSVNGVDFILWGSWMHSRM